MTVTAFLPASGAILSNADSIEKIITEVASSRDNRRRGSKSR